MLGVRAQSFLEICFCPLELKWRQIAAFVWTIPNTNSWSPRILIIREVTTFADSEPLLRGGQWLHLEWVHISGTFTRPIEWGRVMTSPHTLSK